MTERINGSERQCGDCVECITHYNLPVNPALEPRSPSYQCLWRKDSEEAVTKDQHRPDKCGVILSPKFNPFSDNGPGIEKGCDELMIHFTRKPTPKVKRLVAWIVHVASAAIRIKMVDHNDKSRWLPKGKGISRSGVQSFFRMRMAKRGGI